MESDWWVFPGFEMELKAEGLHLPVNIVFTEDGKGKALAYVTELYGRIAVIDRDWNVSAFAKDILNFDARADMPGEGESGVTGICTDPKGHGVFASMIYKDKDEIKNKVVRMKSDDGMRANDTEVIIDGIPSTRRAHQIQDVTIGPDGMLYVNVGDGGAWEDAPQDDNDLRGKILRMNLDGSIPDDNPTRGSYVFAKGFRNPFGAAWRREDDSLYVTVNGPATNDVLARVQPGSNHGWYPDMRRNALFWWHFTQAPTALAFMQEGQFHEKYTGELFVALFGNSYQEGRDIKGKKIVKMRINEDATGIKSYDEFVTYIGDGPGAPAGLSFGPGGLYFTDLHEGCVYLVKARQDFDFDKEDEHVF